jgi:hypothetical protein
VTLAREKMAGTSRLYGRPIAEPRLETERKQFFFEKKNQKTFVLIALTLRHRAHQ